MGKIKIIAADKVEKLEYITEGNEEYIAIYNTLVKKNNTIYEIYDDTEKRIEYFEEIPIKTAHINMILENLYKVRESLIKVHISMCNALEKLKNNIYNNDIKIKTVGGSFAGLFVAEKLGDAIQEPFERYADAIVKELEQSNNLFEAKIKAKIKEYEI